MDDDAPKKDGGNAGAPAWVMTFADLMSLLMCFFVLLLSFSEMDVQKYKQIAGSMKVAFGVQREVRAHQIPKGTSVVKKEFSPAKPQPTVLNEVRQHTVDLSRRKLDLAENAVKTSQATARSLAASLKDEIKSGKVEVETEGSKIIVRILEKGSFVSGSAELDDEFKPVLDKIRDSLAKVQGKIKISGHTDDLPIFTNRFRSNWELSAARATSVLHALTEDSEFPTSRFELIGSADTKPRVPNDSEENRAKNRRVDIVIQQDERANQDEEEEKPKTDSFTKQERFFFNDDPPANDNQN